ncbi:hypothetical protein ACFP3U_29850 [Kitasatospora misakiensis]|uniref:Transcriptional regulator n=1 Tax=Kitasatospora misakiensis TaxID=67330 RepID=A0ABW0XBJ0_9ACTN
MSQPLPNHLLRLLLVEARWTGGELARAVNLAAAECGIRTTYDRTSVSHWLAGRRPRPPGPDLLAEVFSRRFGRTVSTADLGLDRPLPRQRGPATWVPEPVDTREELTLLRQLAPQPPHGRALVGSVYSIAALSVPGWPPPFTPPARPTGPYRPGIADIRAVEEMPALFSAVDARAGGGLARRALASYLAHSVEPLLGSVLRPVQHQRLLVAASQLAYLCAFMCWDDLLHGAAQHYYRLALSLAAEGGSSTDYAIALRGMSVQALMLGHRRQAVHLSEGAVAAGTGVDPLRRAFLHGQLAVSRAVEQDRRRAPQTLSAAERFLERAGSPASAPVGAYHLAALRHQQAEMSAFLGDRRGAVAALTDSVHLRPAEERRSLAVTLARLARLQAQDGRLDEAVATWHRFLDARTTLRSRRIDRAVTELRNQTRPYRRLPQVDALLQRTASPPR